MTNRIQNSHCDLQIESDEPFNPFLPELEWKTLLRKAISAGMEGTEFRDDAKQIYFGTWFYEFDFPIGLLGEKILKVHVNGYKQIKLGITYVFPVQSKDDESWKNLD